MPVAPVTFSMSDFNPSLLTPLCKKFISIESKFLIPILHAGVLCQIKLSVEIDSLLDQSLHSKGHKTPRLPEPAGELGRELKLFLGNTKLLFPPAALSYWLSSYIFVSSVFEKN